MTKLDSVERRLRFYQSFVICVVFELVIDLTILLNSMRLRNSKICGDIDDKLIYTILVIGAGLIVLPTKIYFLLVVRQNWLNLRDGRGDNAGKQE